MLLNYSNRNQPNKWDALRAHQYKMTEILPQAACSKEQRSKYYLCRCFKFIVQLSGRWIYDINFINLPDNVYVSLDV